MRKTNLAKVTLEMDAAAEKTESKKIWELSTDEETIDFLDSVLKEGELDIIGNKNDIHIKELVDILKDSYPNVRINFIEQ